ncbi:MAG: DUF262 domain-containing protein [Saprospiraceae bacterium]|nr:DUF262 domain-containing protein [Saprospiraceae bacterium]
MTERIQVKTDKARISEYISNFEKGNLQVPAFQRDFVWTNDKKIELFDSIKKGYPIGSVLLWNPYFSDESEYDKFGKDALGYYETPKRNNNSFYILDGFQRLSTLIGCLINPERAKIKGINRDDEKWFKEFNIIYNLKDESFEINRSKNFDSLNYFQVPIYRLVDGKEFFYFQKQLTLFEDESEVKLLIERYEEMSLVFQNYEIPNINIHGGSVSEAIDIFQRLNSMGAPITTDWVVSARAFGKDQSFILGDQIDNLLELQLSKYNFENVKRMVILQCITNSFDGVYFDQYSKNSHKKLENLVDREDFIDVTKKTFVSIEKAVKFLFEYVYVLDSKLLPYPNQLIFITDFFNKVENPTSEQLEKLKDWFWVTTYSNYFTIYNLSKQRKAYEHFQKFILGTSETPLYFDRQNEVFESLEFPTKIDMGSVRAKALALFMLGYQNDFMKLDSEVVNGYKNFKLFDGKSNVSENAVLVIDKITFPIDKRNRDICKIIKKEDSGKFFISNEYCQLDIIEKIFGSNNQLERRRIKIIEKEEEFFRKYNIKQTNF